MDELSEEDKLAVARARKIQRFMSQPFQVAEVFTGMEGKFCTLDQTLDGFTAINSGAYDHLPESAFYMIGHVEEATAKAEQMAKELARQKAAAGDEEAAADDEDGLGAGCADRFLDAAN